MPLALGPGETFKIVLQADKNRPDDERPYFLLKFVTIRKRREINKRIETARNPYADENGVDDLLAILREGLAGWGNLPVEFDPQKIEDVLSLPEMGELLSHYCLQGLTAEERKNSGSQSGSDTEPAAKDAPDQKNAGTGRQKQAPS